MKHLEKKSRPRDINQRAKLIVDIAIGDIEDKPDKEKNKSAMELGTLGGKARAKALTPEQRKEIAVKAAKKRWRK